MDSTRAGWPFLGDEIDALRRTQRELLLAIPSAELARVVGNLSHQRIRGPGPEGEGRELVLRRLIARLAAEAHSELVDRLVRGRTASLLLLTIKPLLVAQERSELIEEIQAEASDDMLSADFFIAHAEPIRLLAGLLFLGEKLSDDGWSYDLLPE